MTFLHSYPVNFLFFQSLSSKFTSYLYILIVIAALRLLVLDPVPLKSNLTYINSDLSEKQITNMCGVLKKITWFYKFTISVDCSL